MNIRLKRFGIIAVFLLLVFGLSSTGKVAWAVDPVMTSPTPGARLTTTTVNFQWSPSGVGQYYLGVGTSQASIENPPWGDIYAQSTGSSTGATVSGIPIDGNTCGIGAGGLSQGLHYNLSLLKWEGAGRNSPCIPSFLTD